MKLLKLLGWLALAGALGGAVLATFFVPRFVTWYNTPGGAAQSLCACGELARDTADKIIDGQLTGIALGAVLVPLAGWILMRAFGARGYAEAKK